VIPALKNAKSRLLSAWTIREYRLFANYADGEFSSNNLFTNSPMQMIRRVAILGIEQYAAFRLSGIKKQREFLIPSCSKFLDMNNSMKIRI
jgi:hypothetical protein